MDPSTIITIFIIISIVIAIAIGANDETMAPLYGARILNLKRILILATIFAISGATFLGEGVAKSVGNDILLIDYESTGISQDAVVITILISTAIWLILASTLGLPISTTHATIGGIIGMGLRLGGIRGVNWETILGMSMWWLLSPVVGFGVTYLVVKILSKHKLKHLNGFQDYERSESRYSIIIFLVICVTAFSRAGNDCSNAVGIVAGVGEDINLTALLIMTGISLAIGIIVIGRIVIVNLGQMTELRPSTAFAAQFPTAAVMLIGTIEKIPLSGSHMLVASLLGLSKASSTPMQKGLWKIVLIWFLTFPMAAFLSIVLYFPINAVF